MSAAMEKFFDGFTASLPANTRVMLILDRAGWHGNEAPRPRDTITFVPLPSYSPQLNPAENVFQSMRENFFTRRVSSTRCCRQRRIPGLEAPASEANRLGPSAPLGSHRWSLNGSGIIPASTVLPGDRVIARQRSEAVLRVSESTKMDSGGRQFAPLQRRRVRQ
jgi:hypothetical protein